MSLTALTYVYCVLRGARAPDVRGLPRGLPGLSAPRAIAAGDSIWVLAASAPLDRYGEESIERGLRDLDWVARCAAGHEAVVEAMGARATAVPMKLFTLFASDERAVAHVRKMRARVQRIADRIGGCAEWGVRVQLDERRARTAAREKAFARTSRASGGGGGGGGARFLALKKAELDGVGDAVRSARREVQRAYCALADAARDAVRRPPVSREVAARVLLDAVFLVPVNEARGFAGAVERASASLSKTGCSVALTGPWPPYHFVESR